MPKTKQLNCLQLLAKRNNLKLNKHIENYNDYNKLNIKLL